MVLETSFSDRFSMEVEFILWSRCDFWFSRHQATSNLHPRLSHVVALRLECKHPAVAKTNKKRTTWGRSSLLVQRLQLRNALDGAFCLLMPTNEAGASEAVRSWAGAPEREHGLCDQAR